MTRRTEDDAYGDYPRVERIIERSNGFGRLKDAVFTAVLLAAGGVIWVQQASINEIQKDVAVLKVKCEEQPIMRGVPRKEAPLYPRSTDQ